MDEKDEADKDDKISKPPPTPRITQEWQTNVDRARKIADRCRAKARAVSMPRPGGEMDLSRAAALGDLAGLCDYYHRRFEEWAMSNIPYPQKDRELRAFGHIADAALVELDEKRR